jgi:hypothetical protein
LHRFTCHSWSFADRDTDWPSGGAHCSADLLAEVAGVVL